MKTSMTFKTITLITLLGMALGGPVLAQGMGNGNGPGMQNAGQGMGGGMKGGMGGMRGGRGMQFNQNNTPGWTLMTPEERTAQQVKMRAVTTVDQCVLVQTEHRAIMEARAKEKGITLPTPRRNMCENLKTRGLIK